MKVEIQQNVSGFLQFGVALVFVVSILLVIAGNVSSQGSDFGDGFLQFDSLPGNCKIPTSHFDGPDLPPDAVRVVRIVTINGEYQSPPVSTGLEDVVYGSKVSVDRKPTGYRWGPGCKGRVRFVFLSQEDASKLDQPAKSQVAGAESDVTQSEPGGPNSDHEPPVNTQLNELSLPTVLPEDLTDLSQRKNAKRKRRDDVKQSTQNNAENQLSASASDAASAASQDDPATPVRTLTAAPTGSTTSLTALQLSNCTWEHECGSDVDIYHNHLIVGAPNGGLNGPPEEGRAYILERKSGAWTETQVLMEPWARSRSDADNFGKAVAINDMYAAVGAPADKESGPPLWGNWGSREGAVYVFRKEQKQWVFDQRLLPSAGSKLRDDLSNFGFSLDLDGDRLIVGSPGFHGVGMAYIFHRTEDGWVEEQRFDPPDSQGCNYLSPVAQCKDNFGFSVGIDGNTAVIGNPQGWKDYYGPNSEGHGSIHVYKLANAQWQHTSALSPQDQAGGFGFAVAIDKGTIVTGRDASDHHCFGPKDCGYYFGYLMKQGGPQTRLRYREMAAVDSPFIFYKSIAIDGQTIVVPAWGMKEEHVGAMAYGYQGKTLSKAFIAPDINHNSEPPVPTRVAAHNGCVVVSVVSLGTIYVTCGAVAPPVPQCPPSVLVQLNGEADLKHQFFYNDDGKFELKFTHKGNSQDKKSCSPTEEFTLPVVVNIKVKRPSFKPDPISFFESLRPKKFVLRPNESKVLTSKVVPYLDGSLIHRTKDLLLGAKVEIRICTEKNSKKIKGELTCLEKKTSPEGEVPSSEEGPMSTERASTNLLVNDSFNVYRFVDVADDDHTDGLVEMSKTLADGSGDVRRRRLVSLQVHPEAEVVFTLFEDPDFSAPQLANKQAMFIFDPLTSTSPYVSKQGIIFVETKNGGFHVGELNIQGRAMPKNKIFFNFPSLDHTLDAVNVYAQVGQYAQDNTTDWHVHPALVPTRERSLFDSYHKRKRLGEDIKKQMETLWGTELMQGVEWVSSPDPNNTVKMNWGALSNKGANFKMGATPAGTENFEAIKALLHAPMKFNRAELAFRLSEILNQNLLDEVNLFADGMLEAHWGVGQSKVAFMRKEIINMFAKTAVHEIGHSLSLDHPAQASSSNEENEFQKLTLHNQSYRSDKFQLAFHTQVTDLLSFYPGTFFTKKVGKLKIQESLVALRSVGTANYYYDKDTKKFVKSLVGILVYQCSSVTTGVPVAVSTACRAVSSSMKEQTFILEFVNHLAGTDVDAVEVIVNTPGNPAAGTVETLQDGSSRFFIKYKGTGVFRKRGIIDGYPEAQLTNDIMYGGWHDVDGSLKFQPGLSLEPMKMALALNYTNADVEKVVKFYKAKIAAYKNWGHPDPGFK